MQRPLKFATHLPALGIETHVLAPDDPKWIHSDAGLPLPTQAWVHRARYVGPKGRLPAEELHGATGVDLAVRRAKLLGRRFLVPDENVSWNLTAIPAAIKLVRNEGIDVVITTSPPGSVHLVGAAVKRTTGVRWVADLRDSIVAHPHRRAESIVVRTKERTDRAVAQLVARSADAIVTVSEAITEETPGALAARPGGHDRERLRLRRLRRAGVPPRGALPHHPHGQLLRQAGPAPVPARARRSRARRRRRPVRRRLPLHRPRVGGPARAGRPARADPVRAAHPLARAAAELRRAAPADPGGRRPRPGRPLRQGVRVPRGRAADPRGGAAGRGRRRPDPRDRSRGRRARRRRGRAATRRSRGSSSAGARARSTAARSRRSGATGSPAARASRSSRSCWGRWSRDLQPRDRLALPGHALLGHLREGALVGRRGALARRPAHDRVPGLVPPRRVAGPPLAAHGRRRPALPRRVSRRLLHRLLRHRHAAGAEPVRQGARQVRDPLPVPGGGGGVPGPVVAADVLALAHRVRARDDRERRLRGAPALRRAGRRQPRLGSCSRP